MSSEDELVTVATYRFAPKAEMARALLEQEGFEAFVADATLVTTDWLLGGAVGHIKLQVPTQQAALANGLLQRHPQLLDHGPLGDEAAREAVEEGTQCLACGAYLAESDEKCHACGWTYEDPGEASE